MEKKKLYQAKAEEARNKYKKSEEKKKLDAENRTKGIFEKDLFEEAMDGEYDKYKEEQQKNEASALSPIDETISDLSGVITEENTDGVSR